MQIDIKLVLNKLACFKLFKMILRPTRETRHDLDIFYYYALICLQQAFLLPSLKLQHQPVVAVFCRCYIGYLANVNPRPKIDTRLYDTRQVDNTMSV